MKLNEREGAIAGGGGGRRNAAWPETPALGVGKQTLVAAASAPPIQCYREVPLEGPGTPWRLSENEQILVGPPVMRSQQCFASPAQIGHANGLLATAGSYITLVDTGDTRQIKLREDGQNAAFEQHILEAAYHHAGGAQPVSEEDRVMHYFAGQNQLLERSEPTGVDARALELAQGGQVLPEHRAQALEERRAHARGTDRSITLNKVKPEISVLAPNTVSYNRLRNGGALRLPSDCNEAARVIMGVRANPTALTVERGVTTTPGGGLKTYGLDEMNLAKGPLGNASLVERGGLTALRQQLLDFAQAVQARTANANATPSEAFLLQRAQALAGGAHALAWTLLHDLKAQHAALYDEFTQFASLDAHATPQVGEALVTYRAEGQVPDTVAMAPRLFDALTLVLNALVQLGFQPNEVAQLQGRLAGGRDQTTYPVLLSVSDEVVGILATAYENQQIELGDAQVHIRELEDKKLWNKHWGGVVMTDGADYLTLENDASTELTHGKENTVWGFGLYGSAQPDQSFHAQMMATGDFGSFASTMRFVQPKLDPALGAAAAGGRGAALAPKGGGAPLPTTARARMEALFGASFASVRVHEGDNAQALGAKAYTQGEDVHFAPGAYDPESPHGERLLAHELAHVLQQRAGRVAAPRDDGGPVVADASLEAEADAMADRVARGEPARG